MKFPTPPLNVGVEAAFLRERAVEALLEALARSAVDALEQLPRAQRTPYQVRQLCERYSVPYAYIIAELQRRVRVNAAAQLRTPEKSEG
jgi:hypothetical protein